VHWPWCISKCPYCDFNSHTSNKPIPERDYLDALVNDLEQHAPDIWGRPVQSIFFGGGTPSLISAAGIDYLMGRLRALIRLEPAAEITLEANPGATEQERFKSYREAGINRLSIGVQSFNDQHLRNLGRIHDGAESIRACETARLCGFENFNIDLMHGLEGQSAKDAEDDVRQAIALNPTHLSYYQLTIEPNTLFAARPPPLPEDDGLADIQLVGQQLLADAGYQQYEVSAYAQPRQRCKHNLNYWGFGDYLGIGAGAHSKITYPANNSIVRLSKQKHPEKYLQTAARETRVQWRREVSESDARFEFLMNALRLNAGFTLAQFQHTTGDSLQSLNPALQQAEQDGLIERHADTVSATTLGMRYLDSLLQRFMESEDKPAGRTVIEIKPETQ